MQQLNRLTTLEKVRDWVGSQTSNDDLLLTRLVDQVSRFVLSYISRTTLFQNTWTDIYDGRDNTVLLLRNYPVLSIPSTGVVINNAIIAPFTLPPVPSTVALYGAGWVLEPWDGFPPGRPQKLSVRGYRFYRGVSNVSVTYTTGYVVQNEPQTVPTANPYNLPVNAPSGPWAVDQGVIYTSTAVALTAIPYNSKTAGTLTVGQYMAANGVYYFSAADAGASLQVSYSYVPSDIEEAVMELVGERFSSKTRIGEVSKSLGGQETVSFSQKSMSDYVKALLQPYKRVTPL